MRIALVLGGGGSVGLAYHSAVLSALEIDLGWDARSADLVLGTSAGSIVGVALRAGVPPTDLAALTVGAMTRQTPERILEILEADHSLPTLALTSLLGFPRVPELAIIRQWLRRPWRFDPVRAFASVVPDGSLALDEHLSWVDGSFGSGWPDRELWICAVRQRDLRHVVFGRDRFPRPSVAVAASCAVPGVFRPVSHEGETFIDGGVRSATNADLLCGEPVDLAIVVSPMSGHARVRSGPERLVREASRRRLEFERRALEESGTRVVVVEPGASAQRVMGMNMLRDDDLAGVVREAFLDAGDQLRESGVASLLTALQHHSGSDIAGRSGRAVTTNPVPR